ncbi:MAG: MFS transporter [Methanolinea sp.]|nr:MFS transporter [Methanolinea sp.]
MDRSQLRNIALYFTTDIFTFVSVWMFGLTASYLTYLATMSAGPLGLVGGLFNIPFLFFSLPGGVIADRHDRRRMVILFNLCLLATTCAAFLLQAAGSLHFTLILTLCFAYGAIWALNIPSMLGLVKDMVTDPKEFSRVMGAAASNAKIGQLIASAAFGFILSAYSPAAVLLLAVAFNIIATVSMVLVRKKPTVLPPSIGTVRENLMAGLGYVRTRPPILFIILLATVVTIAFGFVTFQYPLIDAEYLHGNKVFLSYLYFAGGLGGLLAGIYLGKRKSPGGILYVLIASSLIVGTAVIGLALFGHDLILATICAAGVDFAFIASFGSCNAAIQLLCEEEMRGRVLGVSAMFLWGVMSVGMTLIAFFAASFGIATALVLTGFICFSAAGIFAVTLPWQRPLIRDICRDRGLSETEYPL